MGDRGRDRVDEATDVVALLVELGGRRAGADRVAADLVARYLEPRRRYHTLAHVTAVLAAVDRLVAAGAAPVDAPALHLAAWYHDAVVTLAGTGDEARSAALAAGDLRTIGVPVVRTARVVAGVRGTAHIRSDPARGADAALLADADLAVLAADPTDYAAYVAAVRAEYDVGEKAFARGRVAILRAILARPRLFATPAGRRLLESTARANLGAELAALEGPAHGHRAGGAGAAT